MSYPPAQQPQQPQQPYQQPQPQYQQPQQPQYQQPAPQGAWPQGAPGQYPQQQPMGYQGGAPGAPATPRPNPFAGIPVSDWIRDGAAVVLLLVSLALYWRIGTGGSGFFGYELERAATRIDVLLITLLSVISVSVGYLARAGVFGAGMPATRVALIRGLANVPYVIIVLLYIVFDAAQIGGIGIGAAAAVGLTGALLAGLPRKYEVYTPEFSTVAAKYGYFSVLGLLGFAGLTALLGMIFTLIQLFEYNLDALRVIGLLFIALVPVLAAVALAVFVVRRSEVARIIGAAAGFAMVFAAFIVSFSEQGPIETLHNNFGYSTLVFAIGAAIYTTPGLPFAMRSQPVLNTWGSVLRLVPILAMAGAGLFVVVAVLNLIGSKGNSIGYSVGVLVCAVLAIIGALVMRVQIVANLQRGRMVIALIAGGLVVIGLVAVILTGVGYASTALTYEMSEAVLFLLAPGALVLYALFVPKEMREYFASVAPQQPQAAYGYAPQQGQYPADQQYTGQQPYVPAAPAVQGQPQQDQFQQQPPAQPQQAQQPQAAPAAPPAAPPAPAPTQQPNDADRASDPSTPATELHAMSSNRELWPHLAANPSLYPALRDWLQSTGDPAVLEALKKNPAND